MCTEVFGVVFTLAFFCKHSYVDSVFIISRISHFCFRFTASIISYRLLLDLNKTKGRFLLLYRYIKCLLLNIHADGKQGWRSAESTRLPCMWPWFDSGPVHMWAEFVVGSCFPRGIFLRGFRFPPSSKTNSTKVRKLDQDK